ncbi:patatin-like phospholipase family protein [Emticicia sp. 21SJ11W-3]|uniref:patatin-like phospholipase family protein n=1 Tax=Emticicia sp. 21SJ11W-3 TaxID=2916755 RepID=UPI0020A10FCE|nr:patatin-like phospholipase family protein [Emticicia sp. 21SJ11W-3]UTA68906.1 patatin-like phospholipase family protein [Emticicia sp. 21SJ11W-3]
MKIGLALSGGGSRGFAHLGVIKALDEMGLKPSMITGTSAGSIVGALIAAGHTPDYIFDTVTSIGIFSHLKFAFNRFGLFKLEKAENLFLRFLPDNSFESLKIPLIVCATDIENGEPVYYSEGELIKPILASCCLPGIFEPMKFQGRLLIDGGITDNLPVGPLKDACDFVIGVNVMPVSSSMPINSVKDILMKSIFLAIRNNSGEQLKRCDIAIEPAEIYRYDGMNMSKAKEMYTLGYECALRELEGKLSQVL